MYPKGPQLADCTHLLMEECGALQPELINFLTLEEWLQTGELVVGEC